MSQETLTNLTGWFLIALSIWVSLLALNQLGMLVLQIMKAIKIRKERRLNAIHDKYFKERDRITDEVEPKFELWWSETGKRVVENNPNVSETAGIPFDLAEMPEQMQRIIKGSTVHVISQNALSFAVLLACKPNYDTFIDEMRRINSGLADEHKTDQDKLIEQYRSQLISVGIDIDEFEREFSAS